MFGHRNWNSQLLKRSARFKTTAFSLNEFEPNSKGVSCCYGWLWLMMAYDGLWWLLKFHLRKPLKIAQNRLKRSEALKTARNSELDTFKPSNSFTLKNKISIVFLFLLQLLIWFFLFLCQRLVHKHFFECIIILCTTGIIYLHRRKWAALVRTIQEETGIGGRKSSAIFVLFVLFVLFIKFFVLFLQFSLLVQ